MPRDTLNKAICFRWTKETEHLDELLHKAVAESGLNTMDWLRLAVKEKIERDSEKPAPNTTNP